MGSESTRERVSGGRPDEQRAPVAPAPARAALLQRAAGNAATSRMLMREPTGHYEMTETERRNEFPAVLAVNRNVENVSFHPSTGGAWTTPTVGPPPPPTPVVPASWDIDIWIDNYPHHYKALDADRALKTLQQLRGQVLNDLNYYRKQHADMLENRASHPIVGFLSDKVGGTSPPPIGIWDEIENGPLEEARKSTGISASLLIELADPNPPKPKENPEIQHNLPEGLNLDNFAPKQDMSPEAMQRRASEQKADELIKKAAEAVQKASDDIRIKDKSVFYYREDTVHGAGNIVTGLEVAKTAGQVAAAGLGGGIAVEMKLGLLGASTLTAGVSAGYSAGQEIAQQGGGMIWGDQDHFDWGKVAKVGTKAAVTGFVGGLMGGMFTKALSGALGKMISGLTADELATAGLTGSEFLSKGQTLFLSWVGGTGMSPFSTAAGELMDYALDGKFTDTSVSGFLDRCLHDMLLSGVLGGFFHFSAAHGNSVTGHPFEVEPPPEVHSNGVPLPVEPEVTRPVQRPAEDAPQALEQAPGKRRPPRIPPGKKFVKPKPATPAPIEIDMPLMMTDTELGAFVQRLVSRQLPSLKGKVIWHETQAEYEQIGYHKSGVRPQSGGFFDPETGELHIAPGQPMRIVVHEAVHALARSLQPHGRQLIGDFLDEGITDTLTLEAVGPDPVEMSYRRNMDFVDELGGRVGLSRVRNVVLQGNFVGFRNAVKARLGTEVATQEFFTKLRALPIAGDPVVEAELLNMLDNPPKGP